MDNFSTQMKDVLKTYFIDYYFKRRKQFTPFQIKTLKEKEYVQLRSSKILVNSLKLALLSGLQNIRN